MSIPEKYHHAQQSAILGALEELKAAARSGDEHAISAIAKMALHAISILKSVDSTSVAHQAQTWPVTYHAITERRNDEFKEIAALGIGSKTGIRLEGKGRGFKPDQAAGFAEELYSQIEAQRRRKAEILAYLEKHPSASPSWKDQAALLPPLNKDSLAGWADVALEVYRELCMGKWTEAPLPQCVRGVIDKDTDGNGSLRTAESAIRTKISQGLQKLI